MTIIRFNKIVSFGVAERGVPLLKNFSMNPLGLQKLKKFLSKICLWGFCGRWSRIWHYLKILKPRTKSEKKFQKFQKNSDGQPCWSFLTIPTDLANANRPITLTIPKTFLAIPAEFHLNYCWFKLKVEWCRVLGFGRIIADIFPLTNLILVKREIFGSLEYLCQKGDTYLGPSKNLCQK